MDKLEIKDYIPAAIRTESHTPGQVYERVMGNADMRAEMNTAFGMFIEAAQSLDRIKKYLYYKKPTEFAESEQTLGEVANFGVLNEDKMSRLFHAVLGMCTEAGELLEAFDAMMYRGESLDVDNLFEEMGDSMWYFAIGCSSMGFDPNELLGRNIAKLKARYPEKFTIENALNRDLDAEKAALQGK